jgi:hypothetical protein
MVVLFYQEITQQKHLINYGQTIYIKGLKMACKNKQKTILEKRLEKNLTKKELEEFYKRAAHNNHFNEIFNR